MRTKTSKTSGAQMGWSGVAPLMAFKSALNPTVPTLLKLQRILVPLDFSEPSGKALRYSLLLAERFGATLCLLHVFEPPSFVNDLKNQPLAVSDAAVMNRLHHNLVMLARREINPIVHVTPQVRVGKPFHEITTAAKELRADLIVIATHGRSGLKHALLGSTAERVVRHAPCPVLVVRGGKHEFGVNPKENT